MPSPDKKPPYPTPSGGVYSKEYFEYLKKINDVFYDQIKVADQKAAYIFTFLIAFVISSAEGRSVFTLQRYRTGEHLPILFSAVLALALLVSLCSAIMVVLPRIRKAATTSLYWGAWQEHRHTFTEGMQRDDGAYIVTEYLGNIDNLSMIARSKYRFVGLAFRGLLAATIAYVLLLLVG